MKKFLLPLTLILLLAACGGQSQMDFVGAEEAKAAALHHAGLAVNEATFARAELDEENGTIYYDVEFLANNAAYSYAIDALTGAVLSYEGPPPVQPQEPGSQTDSPPTPSPEAQPQGPGLKADDDTGTLTNPAPAGAAITEAQAKDLALAQVPGATESDIRQFHIDYDDGRLEYEGTIYYNQMEYEFEIDGYSGAIRSWDVESIYDR